MGGAAGAHDLAVDGNLARDAAQDAEEGQQQVALALAIEAPEADDLAAADLTAGALVRMTSRFGTAEAVVQPDATMRPGSVSMTHCYGGLPGDDDDPVLYGTNPNRLLSIDENLQTISLMPQMSAVPIRIETAAHRP